MMIQIVDTTGALIGFMEADAQVRLTFPVGAFSQEFYKGLKPVGYKAKQWTKKEMKELLKKDKSRKWPDPFNFNIAPSLKKKG